MPIEIKFGIRAEAGPPSKIFDHVKFPIEKANGPK